MNRIRGYESLKSNIQPQHQEVHAKQNHKAKLSPALWHPTNPELSTVTFTRPVSLPPRQLGQKGTVCSVEMKDIARSEQASSTSKPAAHQKQEQTSSTPAVLQPSLRKSGFKAVGAQRWLTQERNPISYLLIRLAAVGQAILHAKYQKWGKASFECPLETP